ncbi:hypothetical protein RRF57_006203 [Xylaria bambusicola]|uniref:Uncharacterized protein n=1 Tax=Xylaria bambusicola TaxID=326684 RepID=A0AAN7Z8R1_9PEZI
MSKRSLTLGTGKCGACACRLLRIAWSPHKPSPMVEMMPAEFGNKRWKTTSPFARGSGGASSMKSTGKPNGTLER